MYCIAEGRQFTVSVELNRNISDYERLVDPTECGLDLFRDRALKRGNPLTLRRRFLFNHCQ